MYNAALICIFFLFFVFSSQAIAADRDDPSTMLGQKLMLDFRYFCEDNTPSATCRTPMTRLPSAVKSLLTEGRILIGNNL